MKWTPERWARIEELFHEAARRAPEERAAFLAGACRDDSDVRDGVERLLAADAAKGTEELDRGALELLRGKDPLLGARFGAFRLVERIAEGGMGSVYRAVRVDGDFQQDVAVKVLRRGLASEAMRDHFARERQTLARLIHPNVARLLDGGTNAQGLPFFAMEFIDGRPFDRYCDELGTPVSERLRLFATVCRAVHFAHRSLVVHLDLKPSNILVDRHGVPKLLDFGVAGLLGDVYAEAGSSSSGRPLTPEYASPEQVRGEPVGTSSDVYSLGVVLHEVLTGTRPGVDRSAPVGDLGHIVRRALAAEPARRYSSCQEFADDVDRLLDGMPIVAREPTLRYRLRRFVGRNRLKVSAVGLLLLALLGGFFSTLHMAAVARAERDSAQLAREHAQREMAHANVEAASGQIATAMLVDTFLATEVVANPDTREKARLAILQRAAQVRRQYQNEPHLRANLLDALGRACGELDAFTEAEEMIGEALESRVAHFGAQSLEHALSLTSLGRLRYRQGRYPAAVEALREAHRLHESCPQEVHTDVAGAANDLAAAERAVGRRERARELHLMALAERRARGVNPVLVAESLNNLANSETDPDRAHACLLEAHAIRSKLLGEDDPLTIQSLVNLARFAMSRGDFAAARPRLLAAVAAGRRIAGLGTDALGPALSSLAYAELRMGDAASASSAIEEALQVDRQRLGPDHPRVAADLEIQAAVFAQCKEHSRALEAWREVLRIRRTRLPPGHRDIANTLCSLGGCLVSLDRSSEAVVTLDEALALQESDPSRRPADLAATHLHLAEAHDRLARAGDAEREFRAALEAHDVPATRGALRDFYLRQGRTAEAARIAPPASSRPTTR